jgi:Rieske Fe-S protein
MNRRKFITTGCVSCLSGGLLLSVLDSCSSTKMINAAILDSDMIVPLKHFESQKNEKIGYKSYLIVHNDKLQYPVCIYRFDEKTFKALLMKCTHQGTELQVFGDKLQCPAHGSEFNNHGGVESGPASAPLRLLPVTISHDELKISLKA